MILKYSVSVFLSILIIGAQIGLVQTTHICGGTPVLSELSIGLSDLTCGEQVQNGEKEESNCENRTHAISKKPCCENTSVTLQLDDEFQKKSFSEIQFIAFSLAFGYNQNFVNRYECIPVKTINGYIQTKDIPIWNQTFLI
mgnify:CR=1 FL=1